MKAVVFLGPTLPPVRAPRGVDALPPVKQGDVLRAVELGATHVGIVDGLFDQVPAVWHKEILFALEQGVVVYGASSMGALRAAELHVFGMIGVGRVFEMYRDGVLEDDDEVALVHGPASSGYRPASEAMVNIRDRLDAAVAAGDLPRAEADRLAAAMKALPYAARTYDKLVELAASSAVERLVRQPYVSLKERDALALLERMARGDDRARDERTRVERTVFLERLRLEVRRERAAEGAGGSRAARRAALLALLAEEHAAIAAVSPTDDEILAAAEAFQAAHDLQPLERLEAFLESRGLSVEGFLERARDEALILRLEELYRTEIDERARDGLEWG